MKNPLEQITENIQKGLEEIEIDETVVKQYLKQFISQGKAVQNIVVGVASKYLKYFQKSDIKDILKDLGNGKSNISNIETDDTKPYLIIAQEILSRYHILTLEESERPSMGYTTMMMFKNYSYINNLSIVKRRISRACRELNVNHRATFHDVMHYIQLQTLFSSNDFNYDDKIMVFPNGVYDFRKNIFGKYKNPQNKFFFYELNVPYKIGEYDCPKFKKMLVQWLDEKSDIKGYRKKGRHVLINDIFEAIGLCMTMKADLKTSFLNYGKQNTGKTQFFNIITHIVGKRNMSATSFQRLASNEFGAEGLEFKILNYCGDLPASLVSDTGLFKSHTGNDALVETEPKFGKKKYPRYVHKYWFNANIVPRIKGDDIATFDRFIMIHFPNEFKRKEGTNSVYMSILDDEDEIQGIIHEAIKGFARLLKRGRFRDILRKDTIHTWKYYSDQIYAFLYDYCIKAPRERIEVEEMFEGYSQIYPGESMNALTKGLSRHGIRRRRSNKDGKRVDFYYGVKWNENNPIEIGNYDLDANDIDDILHQPRKEKNIINYRDMDEF